MTTLSRADLPELVLARRQHGLVTTADLHALGLSKNAIRHRVASGRLFRVYRGVHAVGRPELTREGRWLAAVLACGGRAVLSHTPAALLWAVVERGDEHPHVTVPSRSGARGPRGVRLHHSMTMAPGDVRIIQGIPVTSLVRTLVDLAGIDDGRRLAVAVRQAERLHRLDLPALHARLDGARDMRRARLRAVLDAYVPGDVGPGLETAFLELCRRHRLPIPETQVPIGRVRADFLWRAERIVVETDDATSHVTLTGRRADHAKDRVLMAAGYSVLRFTWAEITLERSAVAGEIRAHLARRRRELARRRA